LNASSVKDDLRKIRKHALSFDVTQSIEDLDDFYHNMHVPYIRQTHGDRAFIMSFDTMREDFQSGELLRVIKDGMPIAGMFIRYSHGGAKHWVLGVRDGNREFVRQGAIGALYHLSFQYLRDKGFTEVGFGNSAPFFNDGVFRYKKKLGMRLIGAFDARFLLAVPNKSKAAEAFLQANPFIFERDGALCGVIFADARDPSLDEERLKQVYRDFYLEGMSRLLVVPVGSPAQVVRVPPELADKMSVCAAAELLGWGAHA